MLQDNLITKAKKLEEKMKKLCIYYKQLEEDLNRLPTCHAVIKIGEDIYLAWIRDEKSRRYRLMYGNIKTLKPLLECSMDEKIEAELFIDSLLDELCRQIDARINMGSGI